MVVEFSIAFLLYFSPHFAFLLFNLWKCVLKVMVKPHFNFSDLNILNSFSIFLCNLELSFPSFIYVFNFFSRCFNC